MKSSKTKTTIIAIIALIVVCGGSFAAVKILNSSSTATSVVSTISNVVSTVTTQPSTTSTTLPEVTQPTTLPVATTESTQASTDNQYSTFAVPSNVASSQPSSVDASSSESSASQSSSATSAVVPATQNITTPSTTKNANDITINSEEEANDLIRDAGRFSKGFLGYLYDADGNFFYTSTDPWQRNFGFNQLYDTGAPFVSFFYDTMRCKFHYDGLDWMIQFWKGQYGWVFLGTEIGVYYKPADRNIEHYDCVSDQDCLKMSSTFLRKGKEMATTPYAYYWWCTSFVPGTLDNFSDRSELELRARITMKDYVMLLAFCNSLKENGLKMNEDFTVNGLDVFVIY